MIRLYTIGFTQKSAEQFFGLLQAHQVCEIVDTRINPGSQLSGFAKGSDLAYLAHHLSCPPNISTRFDCLYSFKIQGLKAITIAHVSLQPSPFWGSAWAFLKMRHQKEKSGEGKPRRLFQIAGNVLT